jgi:glycosyltransferase involved in cell wall biosynthesis
MNRKRKKVGLLVPSLCNGGAEKAVSKLSLILSPLKEKKKKIGLIVPNLANGGAERDISELSLSLRNADVKIILFDARDIGYDYGGKIIDLGIKLPESKLRESRNKYSSIRDKIRYNWFYIKSFFILKRRLKELKKKEKFDSVVSFLILPDLINVFSKQEEKVIVSARTVTSEKTHGLIGKVKKKIIQFIYNKADLVVALSKVVKKDLVDNFGLSDEKVKIIYNSYDLEKIKKRSEEKLEEEYKTIFKDPTIINVGRLSYPKGQWHLIRAFQKVKEKIPNANLVILGVGELEEYLKGLTKDLGLEKSVHFLGFQKNPFKFIKNSDVFVFPSIYEGLGNALLEAMACGTSVISCSYDAATEILSPDYGILSPLCDGERHTSKELTKEEEILAANMIRTLQNKKIRDKYSKKSIERIREFHPDRALKDWLEVL